MMIPIEFHNWTRYDDPIDYYECNDAENRIDWLDNRCGIYPYIGALLRRDAEPIEGIKEYLDPMEWALLRGTYSSAPPQKGEEIARLINERYFRMLPSSVILMAYWLDVFKDWKSAVYQLRPAIYTYWS